MSDPNAREQECPEGGSHVAMSDGEGVSCRYCRTPMTLNPAASPASQDGAQMPPYPVEVLAEDDDDGTMVESLTALQEAVVGHRIVSVEKGSQRDGYTGLYGGNSVTVLTLDNGQQVQLVGEGDCCAYTDVEAFLLHPERVDHIITGVGTTDGYTTWHIYADMGDVLELTVGWSCGNPFYYAYGFHIRVEPVEANSK